jgi:uncharacterized protein (DUF58 family)
LVTRGCRLLYDPYALRAIFLQASFVAAAFAGMINRMDTPFAERAEPPRRMRLRMRWLPWLMALLLVLQWWAPYHGWVILLFGLGATWLVSYLWARSLARNLSLRREMRYGWAQVGDQLEERFTLTNDGWLPALWLQLKDQSTLPGYTASRVTGLGITTSETWHTQGACTRRGLFMLGPASLHTSDPFGVYAVEVQATATATLIVMPAVVSLPAIAVAPGGRSGEGRRGTRTPEPSVASARVRDYQLGDSANHIHWRTTARRDALFVRQFDSAPAGDWWIILDMNQAVQLGSGQDSTLEHAIILAASLADRGLREGRNVGLVADGAVEAQAVRRGTVEPSRTLWLAARGGAGQRSDILRALTLAEPGTRPLAEVIERTRPALRQAASLIVITPDADANWVAALLPAITQGSVPTVLLFDRTTFGEPRDTPSPTTLLTSVGISYLPIRRELLDHSRQPGERQGRWEWRVGGTGRAFPIQQPRDMDWKPVR